MGLSALAAEPHCGSDFSFSEGQARSSLTEFLTLETSPKGWHHAILRQFLVATLSNLPPHFETAAELPGHAGNLVRRSDQPDFQSNFCPNFSPTSVQFKRVIAPYVSV